MAVLAVCMESESVAGNSIDCAPLQCISHAARGRSGISPLVGFCESRGYCIDVCVLLVRPTAAGQFGEIWLGSALSLPLRVAIRLRYSARGMRRPMHGA